MSGMERKARDEFLEYCREKKGRRASCDLAEFWNFAIGTDTKDLRRGYRPAPDFFRDEKRWKFDQVDDFLQWVKRHPDRYTDEVEECERCEGNGEDVLESNGKAEVTSEDRAEQLGHPPEDESEEEDVPLPTVYKFPLSPTKAKKMNIMGPILVWP